MSLYPSLEDMQVDQMIRVTQGQQGQGGHTGAQQQAIQHQNNLPYPIALRTFKTMASNTTHKDRYPVDIHMNTNLGDNTVIPVAGGFTAHGGNPAAPHNLYPSSPASVYPSAPKSTHSQE